MKKENTNKCRVSYTFIGLAVGLLFPSLALLFRISEINGDLNLSLLVNDRLLWIIFLAPFILSIGAYFAGIKQDELRAKIYECEVTEKQLKMANYKIKDTVKILEVKERDLISAKEKAEHADKLKSEFLAQMSHEIRTPINTILNYNSLIEGEFEDKLSGELKDSFKSIKKASNRLIRTIDMILNLSNIEAGSYTPKYENLMISTDILDSLILEFDQVAKSKNILLKICHQHDNEIPVKADRYTLTQAIANIIDNAIKYTKEGSVIVYTKFIKNECVVEISDTGIGISEEYIPKLFDKFTQETEGYTRRYEGNGLGLALVKKYCKINNAEITLDSKKNVGTNFTIKLALAE